MRRARSLVLGIVCMAIATGCGSTVPAPSSSAPAAGGTAAGSGLGVPSGSAQTGGTTTGGTTVGSGGVSSGTGGTGSVSGSSTGTSGGTGSGSSGTGSGGSGGSGPGSAQGAIPGLTATTMYVGARWIKNQDAANAAIGAAGAGGSDARDAYKAVIDEINKDGGIAGRKVVPVFDSVDATSQTPIDEQEQANCATWTQDNEVFVIFAGGDAIDEECAKKAGIAEIYGNLSGGTTVPETLREYPHYVEIVGMNLVRMGAVTVDGLATGGYFNKGAKLGMVTWDVPEYREGLEKGFVPALARHGIHLGTDPVYLTPPQTLGDLGAMSSQVNNAVLKFQSSGIDHVILLDGHAGLCGVGCMGFVFMRRAQSQRYFPQYGFNDNNIPKAGQAAGFYPDEELRKSVAVGWQDLDKSYDEGWHVNQTRERCFELMRKHGVSLDGPNNVGAALEACDELTFLREAVTRVGDAALVPDNLIAAIESFGSSFASGTVYGTTFSAGQHDGVSAVRNYHFVDSCNCFKYTSAPYRPR